ncbi:protein ABHD13 isoform X2 [Drosophila subobscura]|uniref:protein ABHD13 isoform X2 n=1 Tax=Drosophila subobscura TaxID=7241 RepID=UPI00155A7423|nr:protein ABHD13 isoform X2 [Drosophila subobscura]
MKEVGIALPKSRGVGVGIVAALLLCFIFYYFYGGYMTFLLFASILLLIFYYAQDLLLYHPDLPTNSRIYIPIPTMHNLPHITVSINTPDDVTLHAFWISQPEERCKSVPTLLYFHGNAGNMGHRMQNVWGIYHHLHCNILMVEYRGYGLSTGVPTERGLVTDARAAIDYLHTRHDLDHSQLILFGRSLGGAVVVDVAADAIYGQKLMCAIVENTFSSIPEMAVELVHPSVKYIPNLLYKNKCSVPFLFISGLADNLVPPRMMRALYTKCGSDLKRLLEFPGGSHNDTWIVDGYYQAIGQYLSELQEVPLPLQKPPEKSNVWVELEQEHKIIDV